MSPTSVEQERVVNERGRIILRACPGSGKTYVVAHRLANRISEWGHPHAGSATLSFTNVAHEQIGIELQKLGLPPIPPHPHFLGTIDHFVNSWIFLPFGHLVMGCSQRPSLVGLPGNPWNPSNPRWLWGKAHKECYRSCCLEDFSYAIDGLVINTKRAKADCPCRYRRCTELKQEFSKAGFASQTDANYWAVRILEDYPRVGRALVRRFPAIIIDEAQDTSDIQMRIVDLLVEAGLTEVVLVGDPDQAIYEWREARPALFTSKMTANGWKCLTLEENRRSSQLICQATHPFSSLPRMSRAVGINSDCSVQPEVIAFPPSDPQPLLDCFIALCHKHSVHPRPENAAILARGRQLVRRLNGLPDSVDPWNHPVTKLLAESAFHYSRDDIQRAMRCIDSAICRVAFGDAAHNRRALEEHISDRIGASAWKAALWQLLGALPASRLCAAEWLEMAQSALTGWSSVTKLPVADPDGCHLKMKTTCGKDRSTKHWDMSIASFFETSSVPRNDMTIETVHAAKGKTYDAVMLVLTSRGSCTVKQIAENFSEHEEVRTAYVAMTRPRKVLVVAVPERTRPEYLDRFAAWQIDPALARAPTI